ASRDRSWGLLLGGSFEIAADGSLVLGQHGRGVGRAASRSGVAEAARLRWAGLRIALRLRGTDAHPLALLQRRPRRRRQHLRAELRAGLRRTVAELQRRDTRAIFGNAAAAALLLQA